MTSKRFVFTFLILIAISCNTITQAINGTPTPILDLPRLTDTPTVTAVTGATATPESISPPTDVPAGGVYVPPSCQGQPVATLPAATTVAQPTPSLQTNPPIDQALQLQVFEELVQQIEAVYLYPDFNGVDWLAVAQKYRAKVESGLDTEEFYTALDQLVAELGDEHSRFQSPAQVAESNAELSGVNNYVGIGVLILPLVEKGRVTILSVFPNSSAEYAGLKQHDSILAVDGIPIVEGQVAYPHRVRGPECSAFTLTVQSPGEEPRDILMIRARITDPLPIDARLVPTTDGSRIGYIFIPTFYDETIPGQVRAALESFGELDGLILDNRMNGGGSSSVVEPILSFVTQGTVGNFVSRFSERPLEITADPINNSQAVPLVILVGVDTVSFGEIFSGALQDLGRAKLVGQTTLGNVETLHIFSFSDGSEAWIAAERFAPINNPAADWEKDGVPVDVEAFADWDTFTFENDPAVIAAVTLLGH